ncbi:MAG: holin-associated N-acetylmuramidase [Pseudomonadota bacterium]
MQSVSEIADDILSREGGYVNDPDDPGGPTNFGVTLGTLRAYRGNPRLGARDVQKLTRAEAKAILIERHFGRPRLRHLPECLQATVFDMHVNAGTQAVRVLQRLVQEMGSPEIQVDGIIGPKTLAAVREATRAAPDHIVDAYGIARRNYYYALADRAPSLRKFARRRDGGKGGWIARAEDFISARYHLSEAAHCARVAAWA